MSEINYHERYTNVQGNKSTQLAHIIVAARCLGKHLKPTQWGKKNEGRDKIHEMILRGYCTLYMSHLDVDDFDAVLVNVLEYFNSGLYDCSRNLMHESVYKGKYIVWGWVDSPDTHTSSGERFEIYTFDNIGDAESCMAMLKSAGEELNNVEI